MVSIYCILDTQFDHARIDAWGWVHFKSQMTPSPPWRFFFLSSISSTSFSTNTSTSSFFLFMIAISMEIISLRLLSPQRECNWTSQSFEVYSELSLRWSITFEAERESWFSPRETNISMRMRWVHFAFNKNKKLRLRSFNLDRILPRIEFDDHLGRRIRRWLFQIGVWRLDESWTILRAWSLFVLLRQGVE